MHGWRSGFFRCVLALWLLPLRSNRITLLWIKSMIPCSLYTLQAKPWHLSKRRFWLGRVAWGEVFPRYLLLSQMVGLRMRWGKQRQSYSTPVSNSQHLKQFTAPGCFSSVLLHFSGNHPLWTRKCILGIWENLKTIQRICALRT